MPKDFKDRLLLSDTGIPDIFVAKYAQSLTRDALLLYLWLMMRFGSGSSFTEKDVKELNIFPVSDTDKVIADLLSAGLIGKSDRKFVITDLKVVEVEEYTADVLARGYVNNDKGTGSDDKTRDVLANSINSTFYQGYMPYVFYRLLDKCLNEYKFEGQVVYKLFEYGKDNRIDRDYIAMEKVASDWYKKGYTTCDRLDSFLEENGRVNKLRKVLAALMHRRMNENDIEHIKKWVMAYDTDEELLRYAFRVNDYKGEIKTTDVENTLSAWYEAGVTGVESAVVYEEERHKENKSKYSRKKGRAGSSWKTGAEAGILDGSVAEEDKPSAEEEPIPDDILDMFGVGGSDGND
ncbi:MAG: DnaD domain protein [Clostridiales bacterium]|nr:DnaD domain protein [Clostridiales bacterium]